MRLLGDRRHHRFHFDDAREPKPSSQALIRPSIALALASMKILTFIGLGI
jgi:hypothetical protein